MKHTVSVCTTVTIDGKAETFTSDGKTDGCPFRLARNLTETAAGDANERAFDQRWASQGGRVG